MKVIFRGSNPSRERPVTGIHTGALIDRGRGFEFDRSGAGIERAGDAGYGVASKDRPLVMFKEEATGRWFTRRRTA